MDKGIAFRASLKSDSWSTDGEDAHEEVGDDSTCVDDAVPDNLSMGSIASWQIKGEDGVTCADQFASKKDKRKFFDPLMKIDGVPGECNPCRCCLDCTKTPRKCKQCCSWMWRSIAVPCVLPDSEKWTTGWCVCRGEAGAPLLVVSLRHQHLKMPSN